MVSEFELVQESVSWVQFCEFLTKLFGKKGGLDEQEEFNKLVQTSSVLEYVEKFEELKAVLLNRNPHLDEKYFISSFISGLKIELKPMVRLMKPMTLMDAVEIAQYQEQTVEIMCKKSEVKKSLVSINTKWSTNDKKGETNVVAEKKEGESVKDKFKKISPEEFQYRKNNHLCYKCGEKYGQGHVCKNEQYTYMLVEEEKEKEIVKWLDEEEEDLGTVTEVSLNALSESMLRKTITLEGWIKDKKIRILVDTGSSITVVDKKLAEQLQLEGQEREAISVKMADGRTVLSKLVVPRMKWGVQTYKFCCDVRILDIGAWDMIAGVDWLEQYSPILFDFKKLFLKLQADKDVEEQMLLQGEVKETTAIKLVRGKELQDYNQELVRKQITQEVINTVGQEQGGGKAELPLVIKQLLEEYCSQKSTRKRT